MKYHLVSRRLCDHRLMTLKLCRFKDRRSIIAAAEVGERMIVGNSDIDISID